MEASFQKMKYGSNEGKKWSGLRATAVNDKAR